MTSRFASRALVTTVLGLAVATPLRAADVPAAWYVTGTGGLVSQSDQQLQPTGSSVAQTLRLDTGFLAGAAVGRRFANGWRAEAEFMYQTVDHPDVTLGAGGPAGDGNYASTSVALNALYEFNLFGSTRARTYVGAGIAYLTEVDLDFEGTGGERSFSGSDVGVQLLLGARYDVGDRAFVDAGVRYLRASNVELDDESPGGGRIVADYEPLAFTLSFGWRF